MPPRSSTSKQQPARFPLFSCSELIRFSLATLPVSTGQGAISPAYRSSLLNWQQSGSSFCTTWFRRQDRSPSSSTQTLSYPAPVLTTPTLKLPAPSKADIEAAARALKLPVQFLPANNELDIEAAFTTL